VDFKTEIVMGALHALPDEIDQEYEREIIKKASELQQEDRKRGIKESKATEQIF